MSATHHLAKEQRAFAFDASLPPALEIEPGSVVTFETGDVAYGRLAAGEAVEAIGLENFNAVTGPVSVRGAQPGDALSVEVLDIQIARAWSVWLPNFGGLGAHTTEIRVMQTPIEEGRVQLTDTLSVPLEPMIGCLGVAPASGVASTFMPAYPHGGNFDLREMSPGATLYLPVQVPGALFSMGDLHAAMGTAEPTWVSLEASGQATLRLDLVKGLALDYPRLRAGNELCCLGMGTTLEQAHQCALDHAWTYLTRDLGLEPFAAYAYASARVSMRLGGPACPLVLAVVPDLE
jgi:amidase